MDPSEIPDSMPERLALPEDVEELCDRIESLVHASPLRRVEKIGALEAVKHVLCKHYAEEAD